MPSAAERRLLRKLADGKWHPEPELRSSFPFLQKCAWRGIIEGGMLTNGGTASDRLWRLAKRTAPPPTD